MLIKTKLPFAFILLSAVLLTSCLGLFDNEQGGVEMNVNSEGAVLINNYSSDIIYIAVMSSAYFADDIPSEDEWKELPGKNLVGVPFHTIVDFNFDESTGALLWKNPSEGKSGQFTIDLTLGTD